MIIYCPTLKNIYLNEIKLGFKEDDKVKTFVEKASFVQSVDPSK